MHADWKMEEERLSSIKECLNEEILMRLNKAFSNENDMKQINREMWDDLGLLSKDNAYEYVQQIKFLQQNVETTARIQKEARKLERQLFSPYFSRIDFQEDGWDKLSVYIGVFGLRSAKTREILIFDWRSPISSMFYDYELGKAKYESPSGEISGELLLKRQYRIENGKLVLMIDSNLAIEDNILQDILSTNADGAMKTIVNTIQKEQNKVIRYKNKRILAVQGPAGSGKTSIALHRAAYLLYRYRGNLTVKNIKIFTPNDIFLEYISNVLPELGEEKLLGITLSCLAKNSLGSSYNEYETYAQFMEWQLTQKKSKHYQEKLKTIAYKSSIEFVNTLEEFIDIYENKIIEFDDIGINGVIFVSKEELKELFYVDFKNMPIAKRLSRMELTISPRISEYKTEREKEKLEELAESGEYIDSGEMKAVSRIQITKELDHVVDKLKNMLSMNVVDVYTMLHIKSDKWNPEDHGLTAYDCEQYSYSKDLEKIELSTDGSRENKYGQRILRYEDQGPMLYMMILLGIIDQDREIKHLIIDEAQDYTNVVYKLFSRLYPSCGITLLGDCSQNINPIYGIGSLQEAGKLLDEKNMEYIELDKSYRSTVEIIDFAGKILKNNGKPFGRHGTIPVVSVENDIEGVYKAVIAKTKEAVNNGFKTIALICHSKKSSNELFSHISKVMKTQLITDGECEINENIIVIPSYLAKGLEFDAVIMAVGSCYEYESGEDELFYTACTRALHELSVCIIDNHKLIERLK